MYKFWRRCSITQTSTYLMKTRKFLIIYLLTLTLLHTLWAKTRGKLLNLALYTQNFFKKTLILAFEVYNLTNTQIFDHFFYCKYYLEFRCRSSLWYTWSIWSMILIEGRCDWVELLIQFPDTFLFRPDIFLFLVNIAGKLQRRRPCLVDIILIFTALLQFFRETIRYPPSPMTDYDTLI